MNYHFEVCVFSLSLIINFVSVLNMTIGGIHIQECKGESI